MPFLSNIETQVNEYRAQVIAKYDFLRKSFKEKENIILQLQPSIQMLKMHIHDTKDLTNEILYFKYCPLLVISANKPASTALNIAYYDSLSGGQLFAIIFNKNFNNK